MYGHVFLYGSYVFLFVAYVIGSDYHAYAFITSITYFGGRRYYWMDGGNHVCIHL